MKYGTIYADPPWKLAGGKNGKGGWSKTASPDAHYKLMSDKEILALPVMSLALPDAHLYLWVPNGMLPLGLQTMASWGFRYVNNVCWGKTNGYGIGQYFRTQHELLLFGIRGRPGYKRGPDGRKCQAKSLVLAPRTRHSEKPAEFREIIQHVSKGPYIELFARVRPPGWHTWGNEVQNDVELIDGSFQEVHGPVAQ